MPTLQLLQEFAASLTQNFASPVAGQPEDQLKPAVKILLESTGQQMGLKILLRSESRVEELSGRPDFGVDSDGLLCGYIELKAPGLGGRPQKFAAKSRDAEQWKKFRSLPNLIYTDGNEWTLFRTGEPLGATVRLAGDVTQDGIRAVSSENAAALEALLRDFLLWKPIVPSRPRDLAVLLAPLCRLLRTDVQAAIAETDSGLSLLAQEWRAALFPDADDARFADAYAQTLTYSLLLARVEGQKDLTVENAAHALDENHGLLAESLRVLGHPSARLEIGTGLDVLIRILNALEPNQWNQPDSVQNDPWLYFYEDFLAAYDPKLRNEAGVYYTPVPVIKMQVRLIDELLRLRFKKPRGFNAENVTVLDPAAGTGAYSLAVLEYALEAESERSGKGAVAGAATGLATRLYAFEFLVGPYAVAHLRLTQAIRAAGGHLPKEGAQVYLSDTLESPYEEVQKAFFTQRLSLEHERARKVKQNQRVLVCLGNPPYDRQQRDSPEQVLRGGWIRWGDGTPGHPQNAIFEDFLKPARDAGNGGDIKNIYNDYVYFWRWALWKTFEQNGDGGIVCFITASSYLRGPGFVGMRQVMRQTFDELWIIDLEGDQYGPRPTENVFAIRTGVAIALGVRTGSGDPQTPATVRYAKITGTRVQKYTTLDAVQSLNDLIWRECPADWLKPFLPLLDSAYYDWAPLTDIFPWQQGGVKAGRTWPIDAEESTLRARWRTLTESKTAERSRFFKDSPTGRKAHQIVSRGIPEPTSPEAISASNNASPQPHTQRYAFRSFDRQWIMADARLLDRSSPSLWRSHSKRQIFLISFLTGILGEGPSAVATPHIPDLDTFRGSFGGKHAVPLWRDAAGTQANVTGGLLERLGQIQKLATPPRAEDLFAYCYALLTPRSYVQTFADELLVPGPRIPLTRSPELFGRVAAAGHALIRLHTFGERDLENYQPVGEVESGRARCQMAISPDPGKYPETYAYDPTNQILRVGEGEFAPVSPEVWEYAVSGLRVVGSWLSYRKKEPGGRSSSPLDAIRPEKWMAAMTNELLEVLWTLEKTIELEPASAALLEEVLRSELINADELPAPSAAERKPPGGEIDEDEQATLTI